MSKSSQSNGSLQGLYSREEVNRILAAVPILDVLDARGIEVGRNHKIVCPFHNERTGSNHIYTDTNTWRCYGCHKGGDVIRFVQEYDNVTFPEAMRRLGGKLPGETGSRCTSTTSVEPPKKAPRKKREVRPPAKWVRTFPDRENGEFTNRTAESRGLVGNDVRLIERHGNLRFGDYYGTLVWVLSDWTGRTQRIRRIDRKSFSDDPKDKSRSRVAKPGGGHHVIGIYDVDSYPIVLASEGEGDFLAFPQLARQNGFTLFEGIGAICFPGTSCYPERGEDPDQLVRLKGKTVYFFPHHDKSGAGEEAFQRWSDAICGFAEIQVHRAGKHGFEDIGDATAAGHEFKIR